MVFIGTHGVLMGINIWPKLFLAAAFIMIIVGVFQYKPNGKIRYNERFFQFIAAVLSVIIEFTMIVEMGQGIALKIGSFLGAIMGFSIVGALMIVLFWGIGEMASKIVADRRRACTK